MLAHADRRARLATLLLLLLLAPGCGAIRFRNAWSGFAAETPRTGMEGRWKGGWRSEENGHSGGLRCVMTREDEEHYRAWFYSTYARILFFQYQTVFTVVGEEDGTLAFEGREDLGKAVGGVYTYEGTVRGDAFEATFRAENGDHGVFEMTRVD
jgi:hypothetical protein